MATQSFPVEIRLEAIRFYRDHKHSLREVAKRFGASKRSLIRWLHEYDPNIPFVSFLPIVVEQPAACPAATPLPSTPVIPVAITTGNGSTLHFHLHSFDEITALVRSLKKPC